MFKLDLFDLERNFGAIEEVFHILSMVVLIQFNLNQKTWSCNGLIIFTRRPGLSTRRAVFP